ncbi:hypothetical protein X777_05502 [Ooceraea biroi]|uniref:Uncharacterized protein n=1 Tax=Ooceraea biroi TaxID=2015173 RepID=A0A026WEY7_OOCBI|nr:hypothetical protein X777_05502 [Ooceraea biroi]
MGDGNNEDNDDEDDDDDHDDDEAVDDDEDHVDASSTATAADVKYAKSRRTLMHGYVTAHETNISELSGVCGKLRPRVSSQALSFSLYLGVLILDEQGRV